LDTADDALDGTAGDRDQPTGEAPPAASGQEDGNRVAPEASPAGVPAETGSPDGGILPGEAAQPADGTADPEIELKELKAEYEASLKDLKTELQALKDLWGPAPDARGDSGREADQPRYSDRKLPVETAEPRRA
jgi:hypothetical protein